jgi:protein FAM50
LTPGSESRAQPPRKKKKKAPKGLLSFGDDEDEIPSGTSSPAVNSPRSRTIRSPDISCQRDEEGSHPRRLTPNPNTLLPAPKVQTKATLQAEAAARDNLRREFLALQEAVRNTEILMPFVFYDGTNIPGGVVQVKKGDHIWLFLERCRKVGAQLGVSGRGRAGSGGGNGGKGSAKSKSENRKEWARVGVDDLMCVRGEVIVPHVRCILYIAPTTLTWMQHYEFYYFIANRVPISSKSSSLLFDYSNAVAQPKSDSADSNLRTPAHNEDLEGKQTDPTLTKVVDRRWYERNKHIFPASMWKEFEAGEGFQEKLAQSRRDAKGNAFFFS